MGGLSFFIAIAPLARFTFHLENQLSY